MRIKGDCEIEIAKIRIHLEVDNLKSKLDICMKFRTHMPVYKTYSSSNFEYDPTSSCFEKKFKMCIRLKG